MELNLYVKEDGNYKVLKVPTSVVKDLLRDRLTQNEIGRIHRLATVTKAPKAFKAGSIVVDFEHKKAQCFQAKLNLEYLEPTWQVEVEEMKLENY